MAFIAEHDGTVFAPGWFLATAMGVTLETREIPEDHSNVQTSDSGRKYVPMGSVYPTNDADAEGIIYEDVDVTNGAMPGAVVTKGTVYADRLSVELTTAAETALKGVGISFVDETPTVSRPF